MMMTVRERETPTTRGLQISRYIRRLGAKLSESDVFQIRERYLRGGVGG